MLEAIELLKEELISRHVNDHGLATGEGMRWLRNCELTPDEVLSLIDRAVAIASEHHLRKVEEALKVKGQQIALKPLTKDGNRRETWACERMFMAFQEASRQAHEELTGEVNPER